MPREGVVGSTRGHLHLTTSVRLKAEIDMAVQLNEGNCSGGGTGGRGVRRYQGH